MPRLPLAAAAVSLCCLVQSAWAQPTTPPRQVIVTEIDGIIQPITAEYFIDAVDAADTSGAELVVLVLRTPGGLLDSTRSMVSRMITSRAPVVVFVGPSGARAASAGFVLLIAADIAAMAPATHAGAAHPVSGSGEKMDDTTSQKAASDTAAYVRTLAEARGRNVSLAADAVLTSRAFTDRESLDAMPPLIDISAKDVDELLMRLDGRTIKRFDGRTTTVHTRGTEVRRLEMTGRQKFLSAIAHPQVSYILMTLGLLGLTVELWNPGLIAPGVAGGVCLLLAFFAFQILPVNMAGLLLVVFGIALLILELKVPSFGALGVGGVVAFALGSTMLIDTGLPGFGIPALIIAAVTATSALLLFGLVGMAIKARRRPVVSGREALIGAVGEVLEDCAGEGWARVQGENWRVKSDAPLERGQKVRVTSMSGLVLSVTAE